MPEKLDRCVEKLKKEGHDEDSAWAICNDSIKNKSLDVNWDGVFEDAIGEQEFIEHDEPKGTIVAISVPYTLANKLYLGGGNSPEEMHITLAYMHYLYDDELDTLRAIVSSCAKDYSQNLLLKVGGIGRFSHGDEDVFYASVDNPFLSEFREYVIGRLEAGGLPVSYEHGFTPHITIKYLTKDETTPMLGGDVVGSQWLAETVDIWHGNFKFKYTFSCISEPPLV